MFTAVCYVQMNMLTCVLAIRLFSYRLPEVIYVAKLMAALSSQLGFLAQRNLSAILDFDSSHQRNWVGLASQMGFPYETVLRLREERKGSPTLALLEEWQKKVGKLTCVRYFM